MKKAAPKRPRRAGASAEIECYADADALAAILRELARGVRAGRLALGSVRAPATLRVGRDVTFQVLLAEGTGKTHGKALRVDLAWHKKERRGGQRLVIDGR